MAQRVVRPQQTTLVGQLREIFVEHLLRVDNGTYLQQVELSRAVIVDVAGQFNLYRAPHPLGSELHRHLQQLGQREDTMLQHAAERDNLASTLVVSVAYHLVGGVVGAGNIAQRPVLVGLLHAQIEDIKAVVDLEVVAHMAHIEGVEARLRLPQGDIHLAHLHHLVGMVRADTERLSAVDDIFPQSEGQAGHTFFARLALQRVVVQRTQHTADVGIVAIAVALAHHLLQDDRHLLLVDDVRCGRHISLRILEIDAGIDALDGGGKHLQHLILVVEIGYHIGGVDAGEGLVVGVFEQRAAADGYRRARGIEEGEEVGDVLIGELGTEEVSEDVLVGRIAQRYLIKIVCVHELVEHVGAEHHGLRDAHLHALKLVELGMALDDVVEESQSAPFAAERTVADACEMAVGVEAVAVEECHYADVLHPTVLHDSIEDDLAVSVDILQFMPGDGLEECRHGEDGPCAEPPAHVVARDMVEHGVARDGEDIVLQLLEIAHTAHLVVRFRIAEDEVAEAEVLGHDVAQVDIHLLRVLVNILEPLLQSPFAVGGLGTLHDERHVLVALADGPQQLEARIGVFLRLRGHEGMGIGRCEHVHGEAAVGDDTQRVVVVFLVESPCLLVGSRQHHLGTSAHAQRCRVWVQCLGGEPLALREDIAVEIGEDGTIEADAVFHEHDHLHAGLLDVVVEVHLILDELDDTQDKVGVAQPAEHVVEDRHVFVLDAARDAVGERREHHAGNVGNVGLDVARHVEGIVVGIAGHTDHQVDARRLQHGLRLLHRAHLRERGRIAQSQFGIFVEDLLVHAPVVFEHEGIVGIGNDEHVVDALRHQVHERYVFQVELVPLLGDVGIHFVFGYYRVHAQTMPQRRHRRAGKWLFLCANLQKKSGSTK